METIIARLQTPADEHGTRKNISFLTDAESVAVRTPDGRSMDLQERLDELGGGAIISATQPQVSCMWYQVKSVE